MNTNPQPDALSSRWALQGEIPLSGVAEGASWRRARTIATGEDVVLFIVRGEAALEAADAVRRAYLVEDPHLLPVRDIVVLDDPREGADAPTAADGTEGPTTIVEYPLPPAPPLAALLADGALHPETARAIIGEAATGLETARRRGVRHQFLDSNRVFVDTRSGAVSLLGIGVEAAAHVGLDRSREVASFQDTAALVALLYRALTGRSPRPDDGGHVPRPSAVVDTPIPEDLDLLCDLVLNESAEEIPETTRGLIEALEPWQSIPVTLEAYSRTDTAAEPAPGGADAGTDADAGPEDDELESTALMAPVGEAPEPEEEHAAPADGAGAPSAPSAPSAEEPPRTGTAGETEEDAAVGPAAAAGAAGAAALVTAPVGPTDPSALSDPAEQPSEAPSPAAETPATRQASEGARELVDELHLDQKRGTAAFPGRLDISRPEPARPDAAAADAATSEPTSPEDGRDGAAGAAAAAGAGAVGVAAAAAADPAVSAAPVAEPPVAEPPAAAPPAAASDADLPARTAGSHWPLAPSQAAPGAQSADAPAQPARPASPGAPATTPDYSAPTPPAAAAEGDEPAEPATAPVPVAGRTAPAAPPHQDGPIVVQGRDRSVLEQRPEEDTVPAGRASLLRDVVGVAVDNDAPETFALGPRDQEKRSLQSQWIIIGGAIVVMVALVIALTSITSDVREMLEDPLATSQPPETSAPVEEETGEAPVEPTPTATEEPELPAPEIESVELFEDDGGDPDHTDQQDRLTDGDPSTYWSTKHYGSPDFGGLHSGIGIRLHFAEPSTLTSVTLTTALNNGGSVELRAVEEDGSLGDVLATGEFVGDGEVRLDAPEPVEAEQVAVRITELPPDSKENGRFRARIAEIGVE